MRLRSGRETGREEGGRREEEGGGARLRGWREGGGRRMMADGGERSPRARFGGERGEPCVPAEAPRTAGGGVRRAAVLLQGSPG